MDVDEGHAATLLFGVRIGRTPDRGVVACSVEVRAGVVTLIDGLCLGGVDSLFGGISRRSLCADTGSSVGGGEERFCGTVFVGKNLSRAYGLKKSARSRFFFVGGSAS
jgi:hypothetical protein